MTRTDPACEICIRRASPGDAIEIASLYVRVYAPDNGGDARDHYPFPQILEPNGVAELLASGRVIWLVAEASNGIVGSAAAVRNIGSPDDRIGEVFGVVVDSTVRHHRVGTALLRRLVVELAEVAQFILCEARTASAGGWRVARNADFRPVGFAPYAHVMPPPVGSESMVLTGFVQSWPQELSTENSAYLPEAAHRLAAIVLGTDVVGPPAKYDTWLDRPSITAPSVIRRDPAAGRWFRDADDFFDAGSGVVGLCPLQGIDRRKERFEFPYFVAVVDGREVACARVVFDRTDARARVLGLRTKDGSVEAAIWPGLLNGLAAVANGEPLTVLVWIRAGAGDTQHDLCRSGFFPTAYLPGFTATARGREDVVQYTYLAGRSLTESVSGVTAWDWPDARAVMQQIVHQERELSSQGG